MTVGRFPVGIMGGGGFSGLNPAPPTNYMSFSEDVTKFGAITGGTGAAIPRVFSNGNTLNVGTKQQLPDIPGGEVGTGFTCTGAVADPDSYDFFVGNFGSSRGGAGTVVTPISIVRVTNDGSTYRTQTILKEAVGGLQGIAFVRGGGLNCFAYVDGASSRVCFANLDGTIPRAPLVLPFVPNGCAWDSIRSGLWLSDTSNGDVWLVSLSGVFMAFADFLNWGGPLDHICFDPSRGTSGYLWCTSGANGSPGVLLAWDISKDRLVDRFLLSDAQAVEGLVISGTVLKVFTDGYYHSTGSLPNTGAPYNKNEMQTYAVSAGNLTQWRYSRAYRSQELNGPFGRQPFHLIMDRGDGDTSADFFIYSRTGDSSAGAVAVNLAITAKAFDPATTQNLGMRILGGASLVNVTFGASYVRRTTTATYAPAANDAQFGTRGTQTPDRAVDIVASAIALNLGATGVAYKPRLGA